MPYYSGTTEPLSRIMRRAGISAQIRARGTLRENLVKSKDKLKSNAKTGVVYYAPCAGADNLACETNAAYIGETGRQGNHRFKEHMSTAKLYNGEYKSAVMQHCADTGHSFREKDLKILDSDSNWKSRGIRESAYIRAINPPLNRRSDRNDRYTLPPTYDSILKASIKPPPPPTAHAQSETRSFRGDRRPGRQRQPTATETTTPKVVNSGPTPPTTASPPQPHHSHHMTTRRRARASEGAAGTT